MAKKLNSLEDLFIEQLQDIYDAEQQLIKALPKMAEAAHSPDLKTAFQQHLAQTQTQARRIEEIFSGREEKPQGKKCVGMEGLIKEGEHLIKEENITRDVRDAGLIAAAQKVEHYEIASYGTVRTYADTLGYHEAAKLLDRTLEEESMTNEKLTALAESHINLEAGTRS
jgi:ferritin-like metal-binding protein YciE